MLVVCSEEMLAPQHRQGLSLSLPKPDSLVQEASAHVRDSEGALMWNSKLEGGFLCQVNNPGIPASTISLRRV